MIEAYILVQTEVGRANVVANTVRDLAGITSTEVVSGPYDIIIRASAANVSALRTSILPGIQKIPNVTRILTCPVINVN